MFPTLDQFHPLRLQVQVSWTREVEGNLRVPPLCSFFFMFQTLKVSLSVLGRTRES